VTNIRCRARVVDNCKHGRDERSVGASFGDPDYRMQYDGTWDGESIVCDPCYVELMPHTPSGQALNEELPEAIARVRAIQGK